MPILKIIIAPNPILKKKSAEINFETTKKRELQKIISDMSKTMLKKEGVGLAAPQTGKNLRIIVINSKDGVIGAINPKIVKKSWARVLGREGCLSLPGIFGQVKRHKNITVNYYDIDGKKIKLTAQGMMARVLQHEIDHLDGILFTDKAVNIEKNYAQN